MATTRVKDYTKTINGKLVFVPAHDQTVHHALGRDFEALLQHPKIQALAPPQPKAPEPEASKIPAHLLAGVDQDFQDALATIQQHTPAPAKNPAYMNAANDAADASYAAVRAGAAAKTYTEFKEAEMAHAEAAFKHSKAGMSAPPDMQDFHAGKVQEHLDSADAHKSYAESNPPPEPKAAAPAAGPWQPTPSDVHNVLVYHNAQDGHNKVYKVSTVQFPDGKWGVVAQWGKQGGALAQQVKANGLESQGQALSFATGMIAQKVKKGYSSADPDVALAAKKKPIGPIEGITGTAVPTAQPEVPQEGDVKGALTFHHGRWHATKEVAAPPAAPGPKVGDTATPQNLQIGMVLSSESGATHWEITYLKGNMAGFKVVMNQFEPNPSPKVHDTAMEVVKNNVFKIISLPGGAAKPTAAPVVIKDPHEHTGATGLMSFKKEGQKVNYGNVTATYAKDGLKPSIRLNLPYSTAIPGGLGAKWMPIAKVWQITLPGTPGAGGKQKAMLVHNWLESTYGTTAGGTEAKQGLQNGLAPGGPSPFNKLQVGMKLVGAHTGNAYVVETLTATSVVIKQATTGKLTSSTKGGWGENVYLQPGTGTLTVVPGPKPTVPAGPNVGDTKVENGQTYRFNSNHRWELVEAPKPASKPVKVPSNFPYKQVGPQGGAQPGGQFVDEFGQKWYIKFPQSEEHVNNEILALKFYRMILGKDAVPQVRMVKAAGLGAMAKDGQLGIASKWVDGISKDPDHLAKGAPGVFEGFATDAWLGNWDVAGSNQSQYLNLLKTKEGGSIRVDAGGALLHTGLGALKGDAFGNVVTELEKLRDPAVNKETAHIFKGMTQAQMIDSVVKVLEVPDDIIIKTVEKHGPGSAADKKALAAKLIARKAYLAKRFPEADKIANPPAPDKRHLKVDPSKLPSMLDYFTMGSQGPTGKWVSATESVNTANNAAAQSIYDAAMKGDYLALKDLKAPKINKTTGAVDGMVPIADHPSAKFLVPFYNSIMDHMEVLAYPASAKAKAWVVDDDVEDIDGLSNAFPAHEFGITVADVPANERLGFWIELGKVDNPERFVPKDTHNVTSAQKAKVKSDYQHLSSAVKNYLSAVQGGPGGNIGGTKSKAGAHLYPVVKEAYEKATEFSEGTIVRRWMGMPPDMLKQMHAADPGLVFENPRSTCCGMAEHWESQQGKSYAQTYGTGDPVYLEMIYAKGAKANPTAGSGGFAEEQEVTSLPGQRYMLISKGKSKLGDPKFVLLVLPPDSTYVDALKKVT